MSQLRIFVVCGAAVTLAACTDPGGITVVTVRTRPAVGTLDRLVSPGGLELGQDWLVQTASRTLDELARRQIEALDAVIEAVVVDGLTNLTPFLLSLAAQLEPGAVADGESSVRRSRTSAARRPTCCCATMWPARN